MRLVRKNNTLGALHRKFERARLFGGDYAAGPAVTPSGKNNGDMALRFGTYKARPVPTRKLWRVWLSGVMGIVSFGIMRGPHAAEYLRLSDIEVSGLVITDRFCIIWIASRNPHGRGIAWPSVNG